MNKRSVVIVALAIIAVSCGKKSDTVSTPNAVNAPKINADSAFSFVQRQVDFGPRVPNTDAHRNAAAWYEAQLKKYGAKVTVQSFKATTFDGNELELKNIIASFNPEKQKRILLAAHWDTRPFADKDSEKKDARFDGANDGASGVGVLMEVARVISKEKPRAGVDIILFDGEDWGEKDNTTTPVQPPSDLQTWWCLGSQYWSKNKHQANYRAYYGILLDMVGGSNARFFKEGTSVEYAPRIVDNVWAAGSLLGYSDYFIQQTTGGITDDHVFMNSNAKIPTIDIIPYESQRGFGDFHHTTKDNMSIINKKTLEAVGNTVLYVVFSEE